LKAYFSNVPFVALSGTLTIEQLKSVPKLLGLQNHIVVAENPDRPNIYLDRRAKKPTVSVTDIYESIFEPELFHNTSNYPVTLLYLPLEWCSAAGMYCEELFGANLTLDCCRHGILFSYQDKTVTSVILNDLKKENPRIKLVFCTSSVGMGFNAKSIECVIHSY